MRIGGVSVSKEVVIFLALLLSGCGSFFPGFDGLLGIDSWIHDMPVKEAVRQLQCELQDFVNQKAPTGMVSPSDMLSHDDTASVQLWLQTDSMGNVAFIGVDLSKIGLPAVADLIAKSNKVPSLQLSAQATATIKSQLDLEVPQIMEPGLYITDPNDKGKKIPLPALDPPCQSRGESKLAGGDNLIAPLGLRSFLNKFFQQYWENKKSNPQACMKTLTLQTQFALVFDAKAGLNPLTGTAFILPISGFNGEIQPKYTHSLQIGFVLNNSKDRFCKAIANQKKPQMQRLQ